MELCERTPRSAGWADTVAERRALAVEIVGLIFAQRRLLPDVLDEEATQPMPPGVATAYVDRVLRELEIAPHVEKVLHWVERGEPVRMVLPAFPAKSPSRRKTLGHLPDLGEELAFQNLCKLCDAVQAIYPPGAKITVCSDGRVFADIVHIPDADVTAYNEAMRRYVKTQGMHQIDFFDLDDVYPSVKDFGMLREDLMIIYGEALASLRQRCQNEVAAANMYRGITRFMVEDFSGIPAFEGMSRNAIQNLARIAAYRVIQRSNAWSRLLAQHLPDAVRLSIHPQLRVSEKIGIRLVAGDDGWATPWHAVVLKQGERVSLVPRARAEQLDAALIFRHGRPSHFELPA